jgi:hypothetical protein
MATVYKQGAHYGGEWDFIGEAIEGITTGAINARAQKNLQETAMVFTFFLGLVTRIAPERGRKSLGMMFLPSQTCQ